MSRFDEGSALRTPRARWLFPLAALACAALFGPRLAAEGWSGSIGVAVWGQDTSGSEGSFRSQFNLDEGVTLEDLDLHYQGEGPEFTLTAGGFGGAEPSQRLHLDLRLASRWRFELDYDRRESIFALEEYEQGLRSDDWDIERWHAGVVWDGWKPARLRLDLRQRDRQGFVERPIFALNELYPLRVDLDESMQETALTIETRGLPVTVVFEQSLALYERDNDRRPAGSLNLEGDDPDLFAAAEDQRDEERDIPTTRLVATYGNPRLEVVGSVLWSPAELDGSGLVSESFDIAGGSFGRVEFIDDFVADAEMDSLVGNLRLGVRLAEQWTLRLEGDYRDTSTDASLLGEQILRVTNPFGTVFDITGEVEETSVFDVTEDHGRLTVEWNGRGWSLWGGAFTASRDVLWRRTDDDPGQDVTRDSDGALFGASWSRKIDAERSVSGSVELEHGSFDRFVFRTDPETVDRLTFRLRADLKKGLQVRLRGRFSEADNPESVSGLDRSSDSLGAGLAWSAEGGGAAFGFDLDQIDLTTETDLILPNGQPDVSLYDLSLLSASAYGRYEVGRVRLSGSATRIDDSGDTWPVESWIASARLGFEVRDGLEVAVLGEYWSYDEERAARDDFDVTRYGLGLRWSFQ